MLTYNATKVCLHVAHDRRILLDHLRRTSRSNDHCVLRSSQGGFHYLRLQCQKFCNCSLLFSASPRSSTLAMPFTKWTIFHGFDPYLGNLITFTLLVKKFTFRYFLVTSNYFFYGETLVEQFGVVINSGDPLMLYYEKRQTTKNTNDKKRQKRKITKNQLRSKLPPHSCPISPVSSCDHNKQHIS